MKIHIFWSSFSVYKMVLLTWCYVYTWNKLPLIFGTIRDQTITRLWIFRNLQKISMCKIAQKLEYSSKQEVVHTFEIL